jgi:hypothetical protein
MKCNNSTQTSVKDKEKSTTTANNSSNSNSKNINPKSEINKTNYFRVSARECGRRFHNVRIRVQRRTVVDKAMILAAQNNQGISCTYK